MCKIASGNLLQSTGSSAQCSGMIWRAGVAWREVRETGDLCIRIADSLRWTAELTQQCEAIILQIKKKKKRRRNLVTVGDEERLNMFSRQVDQFSGMEDPCWIPRKLVPA